MSKRRIELKSVLEGLYYKYNHRNFIKPDPLQFVYRYSNRADMEVAGFLAAELAYGRVGQIEKSLNDLLGRMGNSPFEFIRDFNEQKRNRLESFKHRFTDGEALSELLLLLRRVLRRYGSIEAFFVRFYSANDSNIIPALKKFCDSLLDMHARSHNGYVSRPLRFLLPRPAAGSACKRLNLFLRWMVRDDEVDSGLWKGGPNAKKGVWERKSIDKSKLIVPVDIHIGRLCRILGFHNQKVVSLATAVKITECFFEIEPHDPVKYDFALSRIGILEDCNGNYRLGCEDCELFEFCCRSCSITGPVS
jgi:uncharacterized protein (TIGR02757 family)